MLGRKEKEEQRKESLKKGREIANTYNSSQLTPPQHHFCSESALLFFSWAAAMGAPQLLLYYQLYSFKHILSFRYTKNGVY
jgi:hypothetical protein